MVLRVFVQVGVSALNFEEFSPSGLYSSYSRSFPPLGSEDDLQTFSDGRRIEPDISLCRPSGSSAVSKSSLSNGQFLHCSSEGRCWSSSAQRILSVDLEKDGGSPSEEGPNLLPDLDSDEEDAFRYILDLDHEGANLHNDLSSSATIAPHKSRDFHQEDEDEHHGSPSTQQHSHQPSSETDGETPEEHLKLCSHNSSPLVQTHNLQNSGEPDTSEDRCSSHYGGLHDTVSRNSSGGETLSVLSNGLKEEDLYPRTVTRQADLSLATEEPERRETSETAE